MIQRKKTDLELIEEDIKAIQNNVLIVSEDRLNQFIERVNRCGKSISWVQLYDFMPGCEKKEFDYYYLIKNQESPVVYIFTILLLMIEEKKNYHFQRQHQLYDGKFLQLLIIFFIVTIALLGLFYYLYIHYEVVKRDELLKIIEELKQFGVIVKQYSKDGYNGKGYFIEFIPTKKLPFYENFIIQKLVNQAYSIHSTIYGWMRAVWIWAIVIFLLMGKIVFFYMRKGLFPQHQKQYKKLCLIECKLQEAIHNIRKSI